MDTRDKFLEILECIHISSNSAVKSSNSHKGQTSASVGYVAYEERQKLFADWDDRIITQKSKRGRHKYFAFEGRDIKIVSSPRHPLKKSTKKKNYYESISPQLELNDPLQRIIFQISYNLEENSCEIIECYYLHIDRNTEAVIKEVDILDLSRKGFVEEVTESAPQALEIPPAGLILKENITIIKTNDGK